LKYLPDRYGSMLLGFSNPKMDSESAKSGWVLENKERQYEALENQASRSLD